MKGIIIFSIIFLSSCGIGNNTINMGGSSMYPTIKDKEVVEYVNSIDDLNRNDIIVFKPGVSKDREFFIKRIIGLAGDTIKIKSGNVYLKKSGDDKFIKLNEEFLDEFNNGYTKVANSEEEFIFKIPKGMYFVMGDNRNHSSDSRTCFSYSCNYSNISNFIELKQIIGKIK